LIITNKKNVIDYIFFISNDQLGDLVS
jgi:hypothetical protein